MHRFIFDNNLIERKDLITFLSKELYANKNITLTFFPQQLMEMMGFGMKSKQKEIQNKYKNKKDPGHFYFYKEMQEAFNFKLNKATKVYQHLPSSLKKTCKKFIQEVNNKGLDEAYTIFSCEAKTCIENFKKEKQAACDNFLTHYTGAVFPSASIRLQNAAKNAAKTKLDLCIIAFEEKTKDLLYKDEETIKNILYGIAKDIFLLQGTESSKNNEKINELINIFIQHKYTETLLKDFSDTLEKKEIHYSIALLGADFSDGNAILLSKETTDIETFLTESKISLSDLIEAYGENADLDINDIMLMQYSKENNSPVLSSNMAIRSQIRKNAIFRRLFFPKSKDQAFVELLLCPPPEEDIEPFFSKVHNILQPAAENTESTIVMTDSPVLPITPAFTRNRAQSLPLLPKNDIDISSQHPIALLQEPVSDPISPPEEVIPESNPPQEKQNVFLEKILLILHKANNTTCEDTSKKSKKAHEKADALFRNHLEQVKDHLKEMHAVVSILYERKLLELLTPEQLAFLSSQKEHLQSFKKFMDPLIGHNKELFTYKNIKDAMYIMEQSLSLKEGIRILSKNGILNQENYDSLILAKDLANKVALSFVMLHKENPSLLHKDTRSALINARIHVQKMELFIIKLYQENNTLPFDKIILSIPVTEILSHTAKLVKAISLLHAEDVRLFHIAYTMDVKENLLQAAKIHAPCLARGLIILYKENKSLINPLNSIVLLNAKNHAEEVAHGILLLHRNTEYLSEDSAILSVLVVSEDKARSLAYGIVTLYKHDKNFINEDTILNLQAATHPDLLADAIVLLDKEDKNLMLDKNNIAALILAEINVCDTANGLIIIHRRNPEMISQRVRETLILSEENAEIVASALCLLYTNNPTLIHPSICNALIQSGANAFFLAESLVGLHHKGISIDKDVLEQLLNVTVPSKRSCSLK